MHAPLPTPAFTHVHQAATAAHTGGSGLSSATIGLIGVLVGALIGLIGTLHTTSRQIKRQARNNRQTVYANYVATAIALSQLVTAQRREYELGQHEIAVHNELVEIASDPSHADGMPYLEFELARHRERAEASQSRLDKLNAVFSDRHHSLLSRGHELKILAPELVHAAAMLLYEAVGETVGYDRPEPPEQWLHEAAALQLFSAVARADARSPNAPRWRKTARKIRPEIEALTAEIGAADEEKMSQEPPEPLVLYSLVDERDAGSRPSWRDAIRRLSHVRGAPRLR